MRRIQILTSVLLVAATAACQTTTVPERREILGSWVSEGFSGGTIRMTVAETARAVAGAGSWLTPAEAYAFEVTGAVAADEVSLLFHFAERVDVVFQGVFESEDVMVGTLTGDGLRRQAITFEREDLEP